MGGSLLELLAVGEQDKHLIGNPQISFFKKVYKRHTNFSLEQISQTFYETADFGKKVTAKIDKKGDLLYKMYLELKLPVLDPNYNISYINGIGHHIIKKIDFLIGGTKIVSMTGEYIDINSELTVPSSKKDGYYDMIGKVKEYDMNSSSQAHNLYIPLPFWFCKEINQALPLISLQYHDIRVDIEFRPFDDCWYSGTAMTNIPSTVSFTKVRLLCDYIFLDTYERKEFAQRECDFLIEQVQESSGNQVEPNITNKIIELYFNHPVKELFWIYQNDTVSTTNDWSNYSKTIDNDTINNQILETPFIQFMLKFNGLDRFEQRTEEYFRLVQPYQYHTSVPENFIYVYNFALEPEKNFPTGSCNFSKIDKATLHCEMDNNHLVGGIRVYATNYNILRIKSGMAGLMYSD